jgi:hypothetical protein
MGRVPLLSENWELKVDERVILKTLMMHPGYAVLIKIANAACREATEAVIKLDPGDPHYNQKLVALQTTARAKSDFCERLFSSAEWNAQQGVVQEAAEQSTAS